MRDIPPPPTVRSRRDFATGTRSIPAKATDIRDRGSAWGRISSSIDKTKPSLEGIEAHPELVEHLPINWYL